MRNVFFTTLLSALCMLTFSCQTTGAGTSPNTGFNAPLADTNTGTGQQVETQEKEIKPPVQTNDTKVLVAAASNTPAPQMKMPVFQGTAAAKSQTPKRWPNSTKPTEIQGDIDPYYVIYRDGKPSIAVSLKVRAEKLVVQFTYYDGGEKITAPLPPAFLDYHFELQKHRDEVNASGAAVTERGWVRIHYTGEKWVKLNQ